MTNKKGSGLQFMGRDKIKACPKCPFNGTSKHMACKVSIPDCPRRKRERL